MLRVLVHIQQNLDETLSLGDLARVAHFSPHYFHRIFHGMVGETIAEHVRRLRLERAAQRLRHADLPVTRVAFEAGYETHEAFTRAFHARFGASPSEFRRRHRDLNAKADLLEKSADPENTLRPHHSNAEGETAMDIRVESIDPIRVAFMRHTGPYEACGETWGRFCGWAG
jgi:AraC family transcriptional regulator